MFPRLFAQLCFLPPIPIEVFRREPALERGLARRPLVVEHRKIGGVAGAALDDHVLAQDALELKAVAERRTPRWCVERVALPLVAPIAERFERMAGEQILRLSAERRLLQGGRIDDMADLDHA